MTKGRNASGALVSVPQWWRERGVATPRSAGPLDTPPEEAQRATYDPSEDFPLKLPRYASDVRREREAAEAVAEAVAVLGASAPSAKGAASGGAPSSRRGFATFAASGLAAGGSCLARAVAGGNAALLAARARGVLPVATLPSTSTAAAACQSGRQLSSAAAGCVCSVSGGSGRCPACQPAAAVPAGAEASVAQCNVCGSQRQWGASCHAFSQGSSKQTCLLCSSMSSCGCSNGQSAHAALHRALFV